MTCMASPDRYPPRTFSITVCRPGALSAADAGNTLSNTKTSQRNMSEDLDGRCFGLARKQIVHANCPSPRRIIEGYRNEFAGAALGSKQISGVVTDGLSGWIHYIDMQHVIRRGCGRGKTHAQRRSIAASYAGGRG